MARSDETRLRREFGPESLPALRAAVEELSWLRSRGYAQTAALELVGNHHQLTSRQRQAVRRSACTDASLEHRRRTLVDRLDRPVVVDGFNTLITLERALSGAPVFVGRAGAVRDIAGVHGTWRRSDRTGPAVDLALSHLAGVDAIWVLDRPVSNSGRLAAVLRDRGVRAEVVARADDVVATFEGIAVTTDGHLLDRCEAWYDLTARALPAQSWVVDLSSGAPEPPRGDRATA